MLKRLIGFGAICLLAAGSLTLSPLKGSILHPKQASAVCVPHMTVERSVTSETSAFWDVYLTGNNYLFYTLTTWNDGCGSRQYEGQEWTEYATNINPWEPHLRVWVCGVSQANEQTHTTTVWTPQYYYGSCGRQADNYHSNIYLPYNGNWVYAKYENQG